MIGGHHHLSGLQSEQASGDSEGQKSLVCCCSYVAKHQTPLGDWTTTYKTKQERPFKQVAYILMDWIDT